LFKLLHYNTQKVEVCHNFPLDVKIVASGWSGDRDPKALRSTAADHFRFRRRSSVIHFR
jgi:hypothetical protein